MAAVTDADKTKRPSVEALLHNLFAYTYVCLLYTSVVLGYDLFAHMLNTNEDMMKMARMIAYDEGLPVVADPGILSPQAFVCLLYTSTGRGNCIYRHSQQL